MGLRPGRRRHHRRRGGQGPLDRRSVGWDEQLPHGIPHFAISIAAQERRPDGGWGEVTAAVVYQPITDETFWAEKTRGAWLHDARLRVSARSRMEEALIATGTPYGGHGSFAEWSKIFSAIGPASRGYSPLRVQPRWTSPGSRRGGLMVL
jgi:hypothetical protein